MSIIWNILLNVSLPGRRARKWQRQEETILMWVTSLRYFVSQLQLLINCCSTACFHSPALFFPFILRCKKKKKKGLTLNLVTITLVVSKKKIIYFLELFNEKLQYLTTVSDLIHVIYLRLLMGLVSWLTSSTSHGIFMAADSKTCTSAWSSR